MSEVRLLIDDTEFTAWKGVRVRRALEEIAAAFELDLNDRSLPDLSVRRIAPFAPCRLELDGEPILSGVVDQVAPSFDATSLRLRVTGRSLTGQLEDCACQFARGSLNGQTLAQIAGRVAEPFGVKVVDLAKADETFARVQVEEGETVFELMERLARQRGVFLTDDAEGRLVIRRRSTELQGVLEEGSNLLAGEAQLNGRDQYSNYWVKGQGEGDDGTGPGISAGSAGRAVDASVPIHRPMIVLAERQGGAAELGKRAEFEAALRRGRARRWTLPVAGWRRPDGAFWQVAEEVEVTSAILGLERERLLVVEASHAFDDSGEISELTVAPPEGYDLLAERKTVATNSAATGWDAI